MLDWTVYTHDGSMVLVYMLTWLGYIDGIHVTIYSSTMDPSWGYRSIFFATPSPRSKSWTPKQFQLQVLEILGWDPQTLYPQLRCLHSNSLKVPVGWEGKDPSQVTNGYVDLKIVPPIKRGFLHAKKGGFKEKCGSTWISFSNTNWEFTSNCQL